MNVPHLPQERDYSCLAACVRMVLAYYGANHSESEMRSLLKTRAGGTSPANVILRLPQIGFNASIMEGSLSLLRANLAAGIPCIAHVWTPPLPYWNEEAIHAVVVVDLMDDALQIHDPINPSGPTRVALDAFVRAWSAVDHVLLLVTPAEPVT